MADIADALYQVFDPAHPLTADETFLYVDWQREVGIEDVKDTLVNAVVRACDQNVWWLFSGHRGVGKTTELNRMGQRLEEGVRGTGSSSPCRPVSEWSPQNPDSIRIFSVPTQTGLRLGVDRQASVIPGCITRK